MIKILGSIMVIASMGGIGFYYANGFKRRLELLEAIKLTAFLLHGNIKYANSTLPEALASASGKHKGTMSEFLNELTRSLEEGGGEGFAAIWNRTLETVFREIDEGEKQLIRKLGEILMYAERQMQLTGIELFIEQLEAETAMISKELKPKCYLYRMMGILSGIFIVIVAL